MSTRTSTLGGIIAATLAATLPGLGTSSSNAIGGRVEADLRAAGWRPHHQLVPAPPAPDAVTAVVAARLRGDVPGLTDSEARITARRVLAVAQAEGWQIGDVPEPITRRQRHVLAGVARGHTNAQIAAHLGITEDTVARHVRHLLARTGARGRAHLVDLGYRNRWLTHLPPEPRQPVQLPERLQLVLRAFADGMTNRQITARFHINADSATQRLFAALEAHARNPRAQAVALGHQHGHLTTPDQNGARPCAPAVPHS